MIGRPVSFPQLIQPACQVMHDPVPRHWRAWWPIWTITSMISGRTRCSVTAEDNGAVAVEQDAVLGVPGDRAGVRAVLYRRA